MDNDCRCLAECSGAETAVDFCDTLFWCFVFKSRIIGTDADTAKVRMISVASDLQTWWRLILLLFSTLAKLRILSQQLHALTFSIVIVLATTIADEIKSDREGKNTHTQHRAHEMVHLSSEYWILNTTYISYHIISMGVSRRNCYVNGSAMAWCGCYASERATRV